MGVVTWMVETTDNFMDDAAQTTFGNVAGQLGGVIAVASTLAVIGVFINPRHKLRFDQTQARPALVQQVQPRLQRAVDRSKQRLWETLRKLVERGLNDRVRGLLQFFE